MTTGQQIVRRVRTGAHESGQNPLRGSARSAPCSLKPHRSEAAHLAPAPYTPKGRPLAATTMAVPTVRARRPGPEPVDRSACAARRRGTRLADQHGDIRAYWQGCRCPDATTEKRRYDKLGGAGLRPPRQVDGTGMRRRLRALSAVGWSAAALATELGWTKRAVQEARQARRRGRNRQSDVAELVSAELAEQVHITYERLVEHPPPTVDKRSVTWARRLHWAPPGAWFDTNIDDPAAEPDLAYLRTPDDAERIGGDIVWLASPQGGSLTPNMIAARVGVPIKVVNLRIEQAKLGQRRATLSDHDVMDLRDRYQREVLTGRITRKQLADEYGISQYVFIDAIAGRAKPHLQLVDLIGDSPHRRAKTRPTSPIPTTTPSAAPRAGCDTGGA